MEILEHYGNIQGLFEEKFITSIQELEAYKPSLRTLIIQNYYDVISLKRIGVDFINLQPESLQKEIIEHGRRIHNLLDVTGCTFEDLLAIKQPLRSEIINNLSSDLIYLLEDNSLSFKSILQMQPSLRRWVLQNPSFISHYAERFSVSKAELIGLGLEKLQLLNNYNLHQGEPEISLYSTLYAPEGLRDSIPFEILKNQMSAPELKVILVDTETTQAQDIIATATLRSRIETANFELMMLTGNDRNIVSADYKSNLTHQDERSIYKISNLLTVFLENNLDPTELRKELITLYLRAKAANHQPLVNATHNFLIALAEIAPINQDLNISLEHRVVIASGEQFNINDLIQFHTERKAIVEKGETKNSKHLIHPVTKQEFSTEDLAHIQQIAREKNIEIPDLFIVVEEERQEKQEDIQYSASIVTAHVTSPTVSNNKNENISTEIQKEKTEEELAKEIISLDDVLSEQDTESEVSYISEEEGFLEIEVSAQDLSQTTHTDESKQTSIQNIETDTNDDNSILNNNVTSNVAYTQSVAFFKATKEVSLSDFEKIIILILDNSAKINNGEFDFDNALSAFINPENIGAIYSANNLNHFMTLFARYADKILLHTYSFCETFFNFAAYLKSKNCTQFADALLNSQTNCHTHAFLTLYPICKEQASIMNGLFIYLDTIESKLPEHKDLIQKIRDEIKNSRELIELFGNELLCLAMVKDSTLDTISNLPTELKIISDFIETINASPYSINPKWYVDLSQSASDENLLNNNNL